MNYKQAAAYIEELPKFTRKHTLAHTEEFLKRLGNPATDRKVIHVAGTNGKGSVCTYLQAILMAEGKRTGCFTSPHLVTVNERIQFDRQQIDNDAFLDVFLHVRETAAEMEKEGLEHPSYFEFLYGMAMTAFAASAAEYIILETGLGGRLDATNSFAAPCLSVITSISLDHMEILGDTIEKIAGEKAGIIKPHVPVIFDGSDPRAAAVIRKQGRQIGAGCREIAKNAYEIKEVSRKSIAFSRVNAYDKDVIWTIPLCGSYQVMNAGLALEAAEYLLQDEVIHTSRWQQAIANVHWAGRMEEVLPHVTIDGAHNPGAVEAFADTLETLYPEGMQPPVILFSAVADKNYEQMIACLCRRVEALAYIVTEVEDARRVPAEVLEQIFRKYTDREVICAGNLNQALQLAVSKRGDAEVYCLGSLYLAGMIKKLVSGGGNDA